MAADAAASVKDTSTNGTDCVSEIVFQEGWFQQPSPSQC